MKPSSVKPCLQYIIEKAVYSVEWNDRLCVDHVVQFAVEFFYVPHRLTWGVRGNL